MDSSEPASCRATRGGVLVARPGQIPNSNGNQRLAFDGKTGPTLL
jgi:hypothetical protein